MSQAPEVSAKETVVIVDDAPLPKDAHKAEPKVAAQSSVSIAPTESKGPKRASLRDDDEVPSDAELLELTPKALKARLARHSKSDLREKFGTDDPEEIKSKLAKLADYETREEEQRRAALDEKTRIEEDLARANARAEAAELRAERLHNDHIIGSEEARIIKLGEKHLDPDYVGDNLSKLARYLDKKYTAKELDKLGDAGRTKVIEEWFQDLAEKKPKLARDYEETKAKQLAKEAKEAAKTKKPLTSGGDTKDRPTPKAGATENKTYAPGRSNSMTSAEAKEQMRKEGFSY